MIERIRPLLRIMLIILLWGTAFFYHFWQNAFSTFEFMVIVILLMITTIIEENLAIKEKEDKDKDI